MKSVTLILLILSHHGHWFGGQQADVNFQLPVEMEIDAKAQLHWALMFGDTVVDQGDQSLKERSENDSLTSFSSVAINVPTVRVKTEMKFVYQLTVPNAGRTSKQLESGGSVVHVYPDNLLQSLQPLLKQKSIIVWGEKNGLSNTLEQSAVQIQTISNEAGLAFQTPDILFVGPDQLTEEVQDQTGLIALANAGTSICLLKQTHPPTLNGFSLVQRKMHQPIGEKLPILKWQPQHQLSRSRQMIATPAIGPLQYALRIPPDQPILEIAYLPAETSTKSPTPIDAMLAVQKVGKGRIVFYQLPIGDWSTDPRSQLCLVNLCDYLISPVAPTLRSGDSRKLKASVEQSEENCTSNILDSIQPSKK